MAIRALLCAALAKGETRIEALPESEDVTACVAWLEAAGIALVRNSATSLTVGGRSPGSGERWRPRSDLDCGESGTLVRLGTALLAFCGELGLRHRIVVSGSLTRRFSAPLFEALGSVGLSFDHESETGSWPVSFESGAAPETLMLSSPVSSQELSGLLMSLAAHESTPRGRSVLVMGGLPSEPYALMTEGVLNLFGAQAVHQGAEWRVAGPLTAPSEPLEIETDASGAAVALAAACLSGGKVRVPGFHETSWQGDLAIVEHLRAFGCQVERQGGELLASGAPTRAARLDLADCPDLAPVLAAVAGAHALQTGSSAEASVLTGLETLNGKESRRIEVLAAGLRALGLQVQDTEESLEVRGSGAVPGTGKLCLDPHEDHRMAFAFALLGLVRPNLSVGNPECVAKSWPDFWDAMSAATSAS